MSCLKGIECRVSFWGISFTQYHILFRPCRQVPLKKGNSQMDSSVQDNPAAPSPVRGGSFSQKIYVDKLTPLSLAKWDNPRCFILLCGISCGLAGCVHHSIVSSESMIVG